MLYLGDERILDALSRRGGEEHKPRSSAMSALSWSAASWKGRVRSADRCETLAKEVTLADPLVLYDVEDKIGIVTLIKRSGI